MRATLWRELTVVVRRPAFTVAICTYVLLLAGFVLVWGAFAPLFANPYEQQRAVQWALLTALLPWTAARCMAPDRGVGLVLMCALTAQRPSTVIVGKLFALSGALFLIVVVGLPAAVIAQQMSAIPVSKVFGDAIAIAGLPLLVAALTIASTVLSSARLMGWLVAGASTACVVLVSWRLSPAGLPVGAACLVVGGAIATCVASWSNTSLRYIADGTRSDRGTWT